MGGVSSFHKGGNGLAQVQVVQVTRCHALWSGYTCVDLHLPRPISKGKQGFRQGVQYMSEKVRARQENQGKEQLEGYTVNDMIEWNKNSTKTK